MPVELFLAARYFRHGNARQPSLFIVIGIAGVFLGVASLMVVLAVMTGFIDAIKERVISANPHVFVLGALDAEGPTFAATQARLSQVPGVKMVAPFIAQSALFTKSGGDVAGGLLRGLDFSSPSAYADLQRHVVSGRLDALAQPEGDRSIVLGNELARRLGVKPGDEVTLISPQAETTVIGLLPKMARFKVVGLVEMGIFEFDASVAFAGLRAAQDFAGAGSRVTGLEVRLTDPFDARAASAEIARVMPPGVYVRNWIEMNRNLFGTLELQKKALFLIVTLIILVATCSIMGHLVLLVAEKRREIGILRACGASSGTITGLFIAVGLCISVTGTLLGSVVGWAMVWAQNTFKVVRLAREVYNIEHLEMKLTGTDFAVIVVTTLAICFAATVIPARRAARLRPADILRDE